MEARNGKLEKKEDWKKTRKQIRGYEQSFFDDHRTARSVTPFLEEILVWQRVINLSYLAILKTQAQIYTFIYLWNVSRIDNSVIVIKSVLELNGALTVHMKIFRYL